MPCAWACLWAVHQLVELYAGVRAIFHRGDEAAWADALKPRRSTRKNLKDGTTSFFQEEAEAVLGGNAGDAFCMLLYYALLGCEGCVIVALPESEINFSDVWRHPPKSSPNQAILQQLFNNLSSSCTFLSARTCMPV